MDKKHANRRQFLSKFAAGATLASLGTFPAIMQAATPIDTSLVADAEDWLKKDSKENIV